TASDRDAGHPARAQQRCRQISASRCPALWPAAIDQCVARANRVFTVDIFHRQVVPAVGFADVVHTADIRVRDFTSQAYFFEESLQALLTARERERHELERNRLAQPQIISAVNLAHCALAKQAHDSVPRSEYLAGREAAIVKGAEGLSSEGIEGCGQKSIGRCLLGEELLD